MTRSVQGKSALVTGAGSGINLEFARLLLQNGCNVLIADLTLRPEAQDLIDAHSSTGATTNSTTHSDQPPPKAHAIFHKTDVTSWSALQSAFSTALTAFHTLDIICPGAGVFEPPWSGFWHPPGSATSHDTLESNTYKSLETDLIHPIRVTQMAISHFLAHPSTGPGDVKTVVHIVSIASELSLAPIPLYNASKWGLRGFIYCFGAAPGADAEETFESQRGIRVAGVAPAIVKTPIWLDHADKRRIISDKEGVVQEDWVTPEGVAEVMYAICTEDEISTARGERLALRSGSLIEVVHGDVRNVPMFGNLPPGTGTEGKGLAMVGIENAFVGMNEQLATKAWGGF